MSARDSNSQSTLTLPKLARNYLDNCTATTWKSIKILHSKISQHRRPFLSAKSPERLSEITSPLLTNYVNFGPEF